MRSGAKSVGMASAKFATMPSHTTRSNHDRGALLRAHDMLPLEEAPRYEPVR